MGRGIFRKMPGDIFPRWRDKILGVPPASVSKQTKQLAEQINRHSDQTNILKSATARLHVFVANKAASLDATTPGLA
jgi:hypothetical protein